MKRIALIVTGTALLLASCGIASAASKTEGTMPNHLIVPYPAELETKALMLAPNTAYQLLNPVSPEQQVAKAEARKHVTRPQYTVSPEQLVARAEHVARPQYTVSPEQQVARAEHVAAAPVHGVAGAAGRKGRARRAAPVHGVAGAAGRKGRARRRGPRSGKHATKPTSPVIVSQAPTGFGTAACSDTDYNPCFGDGPLSPSSQNNQGRRRRPPTCPRSWPSSRAARSEVEVGPSSARPTSRSNRSFMHRLEAPRRSLPRESRRGAVPRHPGGGDARDAVETVPRLGSGPRPITPRVIRPRDRHAPRGEAGLRVSRARLAVCESGVAARQKTAGPTDRQSPVVPVVQLQRTRTWKASPDPDYEQKAARILALCEQPPPDGPVVSFDQMGPVSLRPTPGAGVTP